MMNPGGSIKDRAALFLIEDAERRGWFLSFFSVPYIIALMFCLAGLLQPGGVVVEGTAGNTGIGLAHICQHKGYKCVIYMPDTQSQVSGDTLKVCPYLVFMCIE
eukprot:Sdes_comp19205_c0_seq1m10064